MKKILNVKEAILLSQKLRKENKKIVLTGGCFDILHVGHIRFLNKAKKSGDVLIVFLENDKTVKKLKGDDRPINTQTERAEILESLSYVDYIINLGEMKSNKDYDKLVVNIKPDILATTKNDPQGSHNERQAKLINAEVVYVLERIKNKSTSKLANIISKSFAR